MNSMNCLNGLVQGKIETGKPNIYQKYSVGTSMVPCRFFLLKPIHWKSKGTAPMVHRWPYLMAWWPFMALPKLPVSNVTGKSTFTEWNLEWEIIYLYIYIYVIYIYIYYIIYIYILMCILMYIICIYILYIYVMGDSTKSTVSVSMGDSPLYGMFDRRVWQIWICWILFNGIH